MVSGSRKCCLPADNTEHGQTNDKLILQKCNKRKLCCYGKLKQKHWNVRSEIKYNTIACGTLHNVKRVFSFM